LSTKSANTVIRKEQIDCKRACDHDCLLAIEHTTRVRRVVVVFGLGKNGSKASKMVRTKVPKTVKTKEMIEFEELENEIRRKDTEHFLSPSRWDEVREFVMKLLEENIEERKGEGDKAPSRMKTQISGKEKQSAQDDEEESDGDDDDDEEDDDKREDSSDEDGVKSTSSEKNLKESESSSDEDDESDSDAKEKSNKRKQPSSSFLHKKKEKKSKSS